MSTVTTATGGPRSTTPPSASTMTSYNCSAIAEQLYDVIVLAEGGVVERGPPVAVVTVDIHAAVEQELHHGFLAVARGVTESHLAPRRPRAARRSRESARRPGAGACSSRRVPTAYSRRHRHSPRRPPLPRRRAALR